MKNYRTSTGSAEQVRRRRPGKWGSAARIAGRMDSARAPHLHQSTPHLCPLPGRGGEDASAMRKMRDDSTWNRLTPKQREALEEWLFDENLGYEKTVERVKQKFGIETTVASVG